MFYINIITNKKIKDNKDIDFLIYYQNYLAAMLVIQQEVLLFDWNYTKNHTLQEEEKTKTVQ